MSEHMLVGRIEIELRMTSEGDVQHNVFTDDGSGDEMHVIQALGALEMAKDSLLHPPEDDE